MEAEKVNIIKNYLSQNGVKYYDVQAELIDHFATSTENSERKDPSIPFTIAMQKAHRAFGGKEGFRKYIMAAESSVSKKTFYLMGQTLLQFLKWPYLLMVFSIGLIWNFVLRLWPQHLEWFFASLCIGFLVVLLLNEIHLRKVQMFLPRKANKTLGWIFYFLVYIPGSHILLNDSGAGIYYLIYLSFLTLNLIAFSRIPGLAIRETQKLYPGIKAL